MVGERAMFTHQSVGFTAVDDDAKNIKQNKISFGRMIDYSSSILVLSTVNDILQPVDFLCKPLYIIICILRWLRIYIYKVLIVACDIYEVPGR